MSMTAESAIRGHCPECGPDRYGDVVAEHQENWTDDDGYGVWGRLIYRILKCRGCKTVYFQKVEVCSEDVDHRQAPNGEWHEYLPERESYWPLPSKRDQPSWSHLLNGVDSDLGSLFDDIYVALNNDLRVLAAIGVRTVFERAYHVLKVGSADAFAGKVADLQKAASISADEGQALVILVNAGNAAAHRGWRPRPGELDDMLSILESFLHRSFVADQAARDLNGRFPPRT